MKLTEKLGLKKPDLTDYVNIGDLNDNMDVLDGAVGNLKEGTTEVVDLETLDKTYKGAINELKSTKATKQELNSAIDSIEIPVTSVNNKTGAVELTKANIGLSNVTNDKQMPISGGVLENYREKLVALDSPLINLIRGNVFHDTPPLNRDYSISNAVNGQAHSFTLIVSMGSTVRTLTFPSSVKWQGGEMPDMSTANKTYVLTFVSVDGGTNWLGMFGGEF